MRADTMTDDSSNPFSHIHKGLDHMNKPAQDIEKMEGIGWGLDPDKMKPEINGKALKALEQEELETLTFLTDQQRVDFSIEKIVTTAGHDLVGLGLRSSLMRGTIGVQGRGRQSTEKMVSGSTPHISVPTTMQKVRRIFTGGKGKKEETQTEEEWSS